MLNKNILVLKLPMTGYECSEISEILENLIPEITDYSEKYALTNLKKQFENTEEFWINEVMSLDNKNNDENILPTEDFEKLANEIMSKQFGMLLIADTEYFNPQSFKHYADFLDDDTWSFLIKTLFPDFQID